MVGDVEGLVGLDMSGKASVVSRSGVVGGKSASSPDAGLTDILLRLDAAKRWPPPSPSREGFRIFVRADLRSIDPGAGTIKGESADSASIAMSEESTREAKEIVYLERLADQVTDSFSTS